jgi:hypothetical protein
VQLWQTVDAAGAGLVVLEYVPGRHCVHNSDTVRPVVVEYVPVGQLVQLVGATAPVAVR